MTMADVRRSFALAGTLMLTCWACQANATDDSGAGYVWEEVASSIFVHRMSDPLAGPIDGNSVVILTDSGVVVVDTHINPAASRSVIERIAALTPDPVVAVINTHWHDDHVNGNYVYRDAFPDVQIIAHAQTVASLREEWPPMIEGRKEAYGNITAEQVLAAADALEDQSQAIGYRVYAGYVGALKPELPDLELDYPDTLVEDRMTLDLEGRRIEIQWPGVGNTEGDLIVWLPEDKVLITGDIVVWPIPFAFDSPLTGWVDTLEAIADRDFDVLIPGHGAVQYDAQYVRQLAELLRSTIEAVRMAHEDGVEFALLAESIDLSEQQSLFTGGDAELYYAWRSYYLTPGLASAWRSLGFPVPAEE